MTFILLILKKQNWEVYYFMIKYFLAIKISHAVLATTMILEDLMAYHWALVKAEKD